MSALTATQATNVLIAHLAGHCEPLEEGTEVRSEGDTTIVVILPEELPGGEVRLAEFVVSVQRRTP